MARSRKKTEVHADSAAPDVFDEAIADRQAEAAAVVQQVAAATEMPPEHNGNGHTAQHAPQQGHTAGVAKKKYTPPVNPFGFEGHKGGGNRVHLLKSESDQDRRNGTGAWVIRFDKNPNDTEGHSKESPHPVLAYLKGEGYRWGFDDGDGKGGWGKAFSGDAYGQDHMEARRVLAKAAEMIGQPKDHGRLPD